MLSVLVQRVVRTCPGQVFRALASGCASGQRRCCLPHRVPGMTVEPTTIALRWSGAARVADRTDRSKSGVGRVDPQRTTHHDRMGTPRVATRHDRLGRAELVCVRHGHRVRCRHHHRPPTSPSPGPLVCDCGRARARLAGLPRPPPTPDAAEHTASKWLRSARAYAVNLHDPTVDHTADLTRRPALTGEPATRSR